MSETTLPEGVIGIEDVMKLKLRVGLVTACVNHPKGDRLVVLTVDVGEEKPRTICAGIRKVYDTPELLIGKNIIVIVNLAPRELMGVTSEGMLLAASDKLYADSKGKQGALRIVTTEGAASLLAPGSEVK